MVDFFSSSPGRGGAELRRMIEDYEPFALTGIVVAEVLQDLTRDSASIEDYLAQWDMVLRPTERRLGSTERDEEKEMPRPRSTL
jgi:hypothetical protein